MLHEFHLGDADDLSLNKKQLIVKQNERSIELVELKRTDERLILSFKEQVMLKNGDTLTIQWL